MLLSSHFHTDWTSCLSGFVLYKSVCLRLFAQSLGISVCARVFVCVYVHHMASFSVLQRRREIHVEKYKYSGTVRGRKSEMSVRVCVLEVQTGKERWKRGVWYNQLL